MLDQYLKSFSRLRADKNRKRWSALTTHQAPHKPFFLLSIMDLIAQGAITQNFIEPSFELVETWNGYWNAFMPIGHCSTMAHPFPRPKTDPEDYLDYWLLIDETDITFFTKAIRDLERFILRVLATPYEESSRPPEF